MAGDPRPRNLIIGTAGHIDHGKTVLVRALTGRDTDRLAEEKERGISIDLGFAPFHLSDGSTVGIVDVPGHENFVRNMMSGATGVDLALLVVAADDGVMPQTREHLAILELLGVGRAVVAITKTDVAEDDLVEMVEEEVRELLEDTALGGSRIVPVSGVTGRGLDELKSVLEEEAAVVRVKDEALPARLPIDRVFTLRGIGTVVTGTLWSGTLVEGQRLEALPSGGEARVRSLQVHDEPRERACAGERVAVNVAGAARESIERGDVLVEPGLLRPTFMVDARVRLLRGAPRALRRGTRIRFHHGTREVLGRIYMLQGARMEPGDSAPAQLRLEERVVVAPGDQFVLRSYSPVTTIGGGTVVDPHPVKHRVSDPEAVRMFGLLEKGDDADRVEACLGRSASPLAQKALVLECGLPPAVVDRGLSSLLSSGRAVALPRKEPAAYLDSGAAERSRSAVLAELTDFHAAQPLAGGMAKETLKNKALAKWDGRSADALLERLEAAGEIEVLGNNVKLAGKGPAVTAEQELHLASILEEIGANPVSPPTVNEIAEGTGLSRRQVSELLALAENDGKVVRVSPDLFFTGEAIRDIESRLRAATGPDGITVSDFRSAIGTSRKFALPLLEYFDRARVTARVGDVRKLR